MGASGGGGNSPYFNFSTYKPPTYQEYVKKWKPGAPNNDGVGSTNAPMNEYDYNISLTEQGKGPKSVLFKHGTDIGALNYLLKKDPGHALFRQGGNEQVRRDAGGNDAIMFDNQGKLDDVAHNALYEGGAATNRESRAYKEGIEVQEGAAANKKKKAAPLANAKGSKTTTGGGGSSGKVEGASQPGSILGGINEAVKSLLGG